MKKVFLFILVCLSFFTTSFAQKKESLQILWPKEYEWKIANRGEDSASIQTILLPKNETFEKWTIVGMMTEVKKNYKAPNIDTVINEFVRTSLQASPKAKACVTEKNADTKNFWAIFKIETPDFPGDPMPESQLWYAIQGNSTLYVNFVAVKQKKLTDEFIKRWSAIFKSSRLIYQ